MKEFVAKRSRRGVSKTDIIAINGMAKKDAALGNKVINASIGTFLDEEKHLGRVASVCKALEDNLTSNLGYPNSYGDPNFLDGVLSYVFKDKLDTIKSLYYPFCGATLGGTGAISLSFNIFLEEGQTVLLPDVMWTNYKLIAEKAKANFMTYKMFDENGHFNLASVKETIAEARKESQRVLVVINDPCQNPTGYCLTEEEYDELFTLLDEEGKKGYLIGFFDIAYISFYRVEGHKCALIDKLVQAKYSFLPVISFSGSKLFGLYGLRIGALIALCPNEENKDEIHRAFGAMARGTYSVPVGSVQASIACLLNDKDKLAELEKEIEVNTKILSERASLLVKELEKANIPHYTYGSGFFITLKVERAFDIFDYLKEKHIYVVPMNDTSIRLALSGLNKEESIKVVSALREAIDALK